MTLASQAATIWAQFARTGNPSVEGLIDWPAFTPTSNVYLDIGVPLEVKKNVETAYVAPPESAN